MPVCAYVEMTDGLQPHGPAWEQFAQAIGKCRPDILLMNEMPFGQWLARKNDFVVEDAQQSVEIHEAGTAALAALNIPAVITSRPMLLADRLANEAIVIENGEVRPLHTKTYLPQEPGWSEVSWFSRGDGRFNIQNICGLGVGVLLCTELMFNEHARQYGRCGADLIAVPRATGSAHESWITAGKMASIVSGSYVVSSNRVGHSTDGPRFGGGGFAITPGGDLAGRTESSSSIMLMDIDAQVSARQRQVYPCYVDELRDPGGIGVPDIDI
ncbi:carbon-nitrogen hydrolase family protein [Rhizobium laguerreae]|uniref:carbon-nitrogen hydrolase family protein n=1 Tax=Rhizobium TaxID=379 RepID=UPI001441843C|nr:MULTISPECIES: carbon-nitrogen hydrolase family protein [Rhizobium]MBY3185548.1 carbon-nitrogen hydrolase family protein [Rhizobium laguerreae]MBY3258681.1 carbon-nitrogen hydrolase family protein [Rhizobium laguerreae]MBY3286518.1 carbon-nitrogen hydrolase family protein [Rhizobium laguerreae]MBY3293181.1 carbon-nitrogen hydrolase family protein [Rhizobium laguerreae]MBY3308165.1 carbon-nitrogen hydrolase family protein [Rhizobium laguerreae]